MGIISEMLSYPFMVRALIGGLLVSLCASLLGVSLVLKRYSMIGDGLSHVSFGSLSIALAAGWSPLKVSIPVVVLAAFFLLRITEHGKVKSDAAIAMISASALAIGIIVTSLTTGMTTDVSSYMFGSILAMSSLRRCFPWWCLDYIFFAITKYLRLPLMRALPRRPASMCRSITC